ncbi:glycoside hydrolase family 43 protein [Alteriqipengyuania sp.]|uniref:glycoside hydrolase family 43 protein n=1 Tax=Alteriqipengyuania sp. TaxID=2800692 RepID=UPI0035124F22
MRRLAIIVASLALSGCVTPAATTESDTARFADFSYSGNDPEFATPLASGQYRNPVLAGFHPDPSVVQVGQDYYLTNSTFGFYPGLPVYHSRDLVNWTQIGNAIDRPDMLDFTGVNLGNNGIYAPAIEHRDGTFYIITTCVACGGNFVVTASDPEGPWSDPIWLPHIEGIDPSIFFDDDGRTYIVHHRNPAVQKTPDHTALWVMEVDSETFAPLSEDTMVVDGATPAPWHTEYIEGPHLYKIDGKYILSAPGGGTGYYHGQLAYRADSPFGPYEANPDNPFLTQLGLPDDRQWPVTSTGHGDMVRGPDGRWWIVFLGVRPYDLTTPPQDPGRFHTGRETFLLPVDWVDGWPRVVKDRPVPLVAKGPSLEAPAITGNFTVEDRFDGAELAPQWLMARTPGERWWALGSDGLALAARAQRIGDRVQPSWIGRRIAHKNAVIESTLTVLPATGAEAGLLAAQNDENYLAFGLSRNGAGDVIARVRRRSGEDDPRGIVVGQRVVPAAPSYRLLVEITEGRADFVLLIDGDSIVIASDVDASPLTTAKAGGFTGAMIGPYAER